MSRSIALLKLSRAADALHDCGANNYIDLCLPIGSWALVMDAGGEVGAHVYRDGEALDYCRVTVSGMRFVALGERRRATAAELEAATAAADPFPLADSGAA